MQKHGPLLAAPEEQWEKNRALVRDGFVDLAYVPRTRCGWNATLAAYAYHCRLSLTGSADLNQWAVMHGCTASARYQQLGHNAVVLWHGTSAVKAERILSDGFRPVNKGAVYAARDPKVSHAYTRHRSVEKEGGSAMFALVLTKREMQETFQFSEGASEVRLYSRVSPDFIEYVLWPDRIEFVGKAKADLPRPWPVFKFKKRGGEWVPQSNPPVRFDGEQSFRTKREWLELSMRRMLRELGVASSMEVLSALYSTVQPWEALTHEEALAGLESLCCKSRRRQLRVFALQTEDQAREDSDEH